MLEFKNISEVKMKRKKIMLIVMIVFAITGLFAQLPLNTKGKSPFVNVVKNVRKAVVNIKVESTIKGNVVVGWCNCCCFKCLC